MSLIMNLEAMAGDTIESTCYEMCSIAKAHNICVKVKFNGVTLMSYRGGDPELLAEEFRAQFGSTSRVKFASVRGDT